MENKSGSIKNILGIITDTSDESLQSVEYLNTVLNDIRSYDMFVKYLVNMKQAIKDIKDSFQYINELAKRCINYECESESGCCNDNDNGNDVLKDGEFTSKSLGLRYNYDAYINKMFPKDKNGNSNWDNLAPCSFQNDGGVQMLNKSKEGKMNLSEYVAMNNNNPDKGGVCNLKQMISNPKKQKVSKVTDIIIKINSDQELYDLLSQLFGDNIIEKLTSTNIDNIFIENIEKTIQEIERLRLNDNNNIEQQQQNQTQNQQLQIKQPLRSKLLQIEESNNLFYESPTHPKPTHKNDETTNTFTYSDELLSRTGLLPKQHHSSYNNEQQTKSHSTTKQNPKHQRTSSKHSINKDNKDKQHNLNNNNTKYPHPKLFINYTSQYGNYFDTPLQRGGLSKIPSYIKHKNQTQT